jgi:hypothetical protein
MAVAPDLNIPDQAEKAWYVGASQRVDEGDRATKKGFAGMLQRSGFASCHGLVWLYITLLCIAFAVAGFLVSGKSPNETFQRISITSL